MHSGTRRGYEHQTLSVAPIRLPRMCWLRGRGRPSLHVRLPHPPKHIHASTTNSRLRHASQVTTNRLSSIPYSEVQAWVVGAGIQSEDGSVAGVRFGDDGVVEHDNRFDDEDDDKDFGLDRMLGWGDNGADTNRTGRYGELCLRPSELGC